MPAGTSGKFDYARSSANSKHRNVPRGNDGAIKTPRNNFPEGLDVRSVHNHALYGLITIPRKGSSTCLSVQPQREPVLINAVSAKPLRKWGDKQGARQYSKTHIQE